MQSGSDLSSYVDERPRDGVFRVDRRVFTDPAVFEQEMERVFERGWVYVCHESQVRANGDYLATTIGRQPVFALRGSTGKVGVFVDACTHRGARLTHARAGNARALVCRYHSWTFDTDGRCVGVMAERTGWPEGFDKSRHDLTPAARVESYRGFVFASLSPDVPPLAGHLADSRAFLDITCEPQPTELEVIGVPVSYVLRANWKLVHENSADSYHAATVHRNYGKAIAKQVEQGGRAVTGGRFMLRKKVESGTFDLGHGHGLFWTEREDPENFPVHAHKSRLEQTEPEGRLRWVLGRGRQLTVFPNLAVNDLLKSTAFRSYRPLAVDATEVTISCLAPRGESVESRRNRLRHFETLFLPGSMLHSDDIAMLELVQSSDRGWASPWTDYSRGMAFKVDGANDAARDLELSPDQSSPDSWDDMAMQALYRQWARQMGKAA